MSEQRKKTVQTESQSPFSPLLLSHFARAALLGTELLCALFAVSPGREVSRSPAQLICPALSIQGGTYQSESKSLPSLSVTTTEADPAA